MINKIYKYGFVVSAVITCAINLNCQPKKCTFA